jgi:oxalate decarboxylase/phosphoglucose isomerase-like protein (cupin superfamily)
VNARIVQALSTHRRDEQPRKQGIWFTDRMQAATWQLAPGQRIVAHCHPKADSLIIVLSGAGEFFVYEDVDPNPAVCYISEPDTVVVPPPPGDLGNPTRTAVGPGSIAVTAAGWFYGLVNTGTDTVVVVAVTAPDPSSSVYTVRTPLPGNNDGNQ